MSVLLADAEDYQVRRRRETLDASRFPVASFPDDPDWTGEGASQQQPDQSWTARLDPSAWPLNYGDQVRTPAGVPLYVRTAQLVPSDADPVWDEVRHVAVTAQMGALEHNDAEQASG